jgi:replication factor C subunit 3/5
MAIVVNNRIPWVEKFRPKKLCDVISNEGIMNTFTGYVKNKFIPHLIFHGPPGTGKTSTITALAKELYGNNYDFMVLEINASEERGIEVVRNKIKQFVLAKSIFHQSTVGLFKLVILDEADSMTTDAQSMLKRVIEYYTENARFCLICNKIKNIDVAIQSRCTIFRFSQLKTQDIEKRLKTIAKTTNLTLKQSGIDAIIKIANGDMRKVLNTLQSTHMAYDVIDYDSVTKCAGYPTKKDIDTIYNSLMNDNFKNAYDVMHKIKTQHGYSLLEILYELHEYVVKDYIAKKIVDKTAINILSMLKDVEIILISDPNDNIQMSGIVSIFCLHR